MSLYILRLCLGFNLIRGLCVTVEMGYLSVGRNEFICNQWERRGMHTDVCFYVTSLNCTLILMSICN